MKVGELNAEFGPAVDRVEKDYGAASQENEKLTTLNPKNLIDPVQR